MHLIRPITAYDNTIHLMRKDVNLSFEDDVIWSYIKDREILPFEKDLRVKASIAKGGIKGALFSVLCCLSHDLSLKISYTQPKESFTFLTSQGTLE